jgi:hypothetical protein
MNYRFDIDEWLLRFPLRPEHGGFSGEIITSPSHICNNEHLRMEAADQFDWGPAVPADVFVMAEGEPKDRHITKIGGLPYRPADWEWPTSSEGSPMTFIAQFDFTDSIDITGELPGDVLLVFTPDNGEEGGMETYEFEWQPLGMTNLMSPRHVPRQNWRIDPCHGYLCRTLSYPKAQRTEKSKDTKHPRSRGMEIWRSHHLLQYQATQIGEAPYFIQEGDNDLPGRILCAISSVGPDYHKPFPWVNHPEPLTPEGKWNFDKNYFNFGDVGCIYISIDNMGQLHSSQSCY